MHEPHEWWLCANCGTPHHSDEPVPYQACPECNAAMRYDVGAHLEEIARIMQSCDGGPECTTA